MMERNEFEVWAKGRFSLDWNYCGQAKPGDYVAERTREAWSAWQSSSSRLREGLRELAERHDGTAAELDAIFGKPWAKPLHEVTAIELKRDLLKMFAGEIRALLSLEGDKTT